MREPQTVGRVTGKDSHAFFYLSPNPRDYREQSFKVDFPTPYKWNDSGRDIKSFRPSNSPSYSEQRHLNHKGVSVSDLLSLVQIHL